MAIDWPDTAELKQVLDVTSGDWDDMLDRIRLAAIDKVKLDTYGTVAAYDAAKPEGPDSNESQAALRMAELLSLKPEAAVGVVTDPTYNRLLYGHRRSFGIA